MRGNAACGRERREDIGEWRGLEGNCGGKWSDWVYNDTSSGALGLLNGSK